MFPKEDKPINWVGVRIAAIALLFAVAAVLLASRAYLIHVTDGEKLQRRAAKQRTRVIHVEGRRGMIFDRSGEQMASSLEVDSIYARPHKSEDKKRTAKLLAQALDMDEEVVLKKLNEDKAFVWIKRRVSPLAAEKVEKAELKGVSSVKEHKRFYPMKSLAAHVMGFAGIDSKGLEGVELYYDHDLRAQRVPITAERDAQGRPVTFAALAEGPTRHDLRLTIDKNIQYSAEKHLEEAVEATDAKGGTVVVMDADSGEILAMAVRPTYNLNLFQKSPARVRRNRAVADTFEPGSTFKVFLAAALLDLNRVRSDEKIYCNRGLYRYKGAEIHDIVGHGKLTFEEILINSSNIGAVKLSEKLKKGEFYRLLKGFGFGCATGTDIRGESPGILPRPGKWSSITKANMAFGQGVSVTALQIATAFSSIINGGFLRRPHLMKTVTTPLGETIRETRPMIVRRVIKPSTSEHMVNILRRVVREGTGRRAGIKGVDIVGKTGTAQKPDSSGGYSKDKYVASFLGALIGTRPKVVVFVSIDEPTGKHKTGGYIAAPVFKKIARDILALCGGGVPEAAPILASTGSGASRAARRSRSALRIRRGPHPGEWIMPNLKGLGAREVLDVCGRIKCDAFIRGAGQVIRQHPAPGKIFKEGSNLKVSLEEKAS